MRVIIDGFGGDHAPLAVLKGCVLAAKEYDVEIAVTGDPALLKKTAEENQIDISALSFLPSKQVIPIEAEPHSILSDYADSSMAVGLKALANQEGDAFVSAGSTGALVIGSSLIVKRIHGIKRAALASIIPSENGRYILLDIGANIECRPEMLLQFGVMGSTYMEKILEVSSPKVAMVNIGAEETKGGPLQLDTYALFQKSNIVHFIGNIEPRYLPRGDADVVVCDGFTGNVILKLTEGLGSMMSHTLKNIFLSDTKGKIAAALVIKKIKEFKKSMDYTEYGGAPLLGISKPVIKAHGSSDPKAFKNAIRQAISFSTTNVIGQISESLHELKQKQDTAD